MLSFNILFCLFIYLFLFPGADDNIINITDVCIIIIEAYIILQNE